MVKGGLNVVLQTHVERVFQRRGWTSFQEASHATGVPASTIQRLRAGLNVRPQTAVRFGMGAGEAPERWELIAVGHDPDAPLRDETGEPDPRLAGIAPELIAYMHDPAVADLVLSFVAFPPEARRSLADMLKAMRRSFDLQRETKTFQAEDAKLPS